jgi:hypothetical protein
MSPKPEKKSHNPELTTVPDEVAIERVHECERVIANIVTEYLTIERNLSEDEDLASAFGLSMLSQLLIGLQHPQTPEALQAIELAYATLRYPHHYAQLEECLATIDKVPEGSTLPQNVARNLHSYSPPEDTRDDNPIGEALRFFARCTSQQIQAHLTPVSNSHKDPGVRKWLKDFILHHCPETIPADDLIRSLRELAQRESTTPEEWHQARESLSLLDRSATPRSQLLKLFEELLPVLLNSDEHPRPWVVERILKLVTENGETTDSISSHVRTLLARACAEPAPAHELSVPLGYLHRFHPEELEPFVRDYLWASARANYVNFGSRGDYDIRLVLEKLDRISTPDTFAAIQMAFAAGYFPISLSPGNTLGELFANSNLPEAKGEIALTFFNAIEDLTRDKIARGEEADEAALREYALRPTHLSKLTLAAQQIAAGGFSGGKALAALKYHLLEHIGDAASIKVIFAARLIAGHDSPEVEEILFEAFTATRDKEFRDVLAESLATRRETHTRALLQHLWSEDTSLAASSLLCFKNTQDPEEHRVILLACRGLLSGSSHNPEDVARIINTALTMLASSPGEHVDALFLKAITSPFEAVRGHALNLCFSSKQHRHWFLAYRPEELLPTIAMKLYLREDISQGGKIRMATLLGRYATQEPVKQFLREQLENEFLNDRLATTLFSSLASAAEPEHMRQLFDFLRRRRIDPRSSPSIEMEYGLQPGRSGLFHMKDLNEGDSVPLRDAMSNFLALKQSVLQNALSRSSIGKREAELPPGKN